MKLKINPTQAEWKEITTRPASNTIELRRTVQEIIDEVAKKGDEAVRRFNLDFGGTSPESTVVSPDEFAYAEFEISIELKDAIAQASNNILKYHKAQLQKSIAVEIGDGIKCWQRQVGIEKVGLYIPGGTAPLFSTVLMLAIPAMIAGCREIVMCTPPDANGKLHPAILYAAKKCGVSKVFKMGGAQAIAAMAYGTETIPAVHKIFGPGNQYVTCAKQLIQLDGVAIDMPAGPSEVCIIADDTAIPSFVAADLISQAEHGRDSQVLLITTSKKLAMLVEEQIAFQSKDLPRKEIAEKVLSESYAVVFDKKSEAIQLANEYAPEHLILCCEEGTDLAAEVVNAGSVFIGNYSPEAAGDYASGTNHTLPTNGYAKAYSGITVNSFCKTISFQQITRDGLISIGNSIVEMANAEGLHGHANAIKIRS